MSIHIHTIRGVRTRYRERTTQHQNTNISTYISTPYQRHMHAQKKVCGMCVYGICSCAIVRCRRRRRRTFCYTVRNADADTKDVAACARLFHHHVSVDPRRCALGVADVHTLCVYIFVGLFWVYYMTSMLSMHRRAIIHWRLWRQNRFSNKSNVMFTA